MNSPCTKTTIVAPWVLLNGNIHGLLNIQKYWSIRNKVIAQKPFCPMPI